jgi:spermidine synthase
MATPSDKQDWFASLPSSLKYINTATLQQLFVFPEDMKAHQPLETNRLNNQALVNYFEDEWGKYTE